MLTCRLSSEDTTKLLLQLLHTLVSSSEGAQALVKLEDLTSLTEIAPAHSIVLDILSFAWLTAMAVTEDKTLLAAQVSVTLQNLVSSFATTDAVTLLEFLGAFLRQADTAVSRSSKISFCWNLSLIRLFYLDNPLRPQVVKDCSRIHPESGD